MPKRNNLAKDRYLETRDFQQLVFFLREVTEFAKQKRLQFCTPEVYLRVLITKEHLRNLLQDHKVNYKGLVEALDNYIDELECVPKSKEYRIEDSVAARAVFEQSRQMAESTQSPYSVFFYFSALYLYQPTDASRILHQFIKPRVMKVILKKYADLYYLDEPENDPFFGDRKQDVEFDDDDDFDSDDYDSDDEEDREDEACVLLNDNLSYSGFDFYGREDDLRRAIMTLLKSHKGNIVFVGDRGVGKSAMIKGLIKAHNDFRSGSRFNGAKFYKLNPSAVVTGVSYTDEIENHIADIIGSVTMPDGATSMAVIFVDNMADMVPQNVNDTTPDTLKLLISLTQDTDARIVTTATFEQYKRLTQNNPYIEKNFTRIDLAEPKVDPDCRNILSIAIDGIVSKHLLKSEDGVVDYVVDTALSSYSKEMAMPGRAIDLLESVCAFTEMKASLKKKPEPKIVSRASVDNYLKAMGFDNISMRETKEERLRELEPNILKKIFGQDEAVHGVAQSVLLAKAGLSDDSKPLASYLFVGPTGVGKTELAKVLAAELGTRLIRFDMSEYSEQHTVSKLVGSPAGYVGYDDGGLLTDAVRKNPHCVLLFDEIEKAHSAVFNLLLQVLDYAKLTDNKGQKADFTGTIIIMTSNAGARFATGKGLGFGANSEKSEVMGAELKRVFAPEFLNRLTQIVSFHDMSRDMAVQILDRKVSELQSILEKKRNVRFSLSPEAREVLLGTGFSSHYGAREMDRSIGKLLKPALMEALLFGGVKEGDTLAVDKDGDKLKVSVNK